MSAQVIFSALRSIVPCAARTTDAVGGNHSLLGGETVARASALTLSSNRNYSGSTANSAVFPPPFVFFPAESPALPYT